MGKSNDICDTELAFVVRLMIASVWGMLLLYRYLWRVNPLLLIVPFFVLGWLFP